MKLSIGTVIHHVFGYAIMFGLGGVFVELLEDVAFREIDSEEPLVNSSFRTKRSVDPESRAYHSVAYWIPVPDRARHDVRTPE